MSKPPRSRPRKLTENEMRHKKLKEFQKKIKKECEEFKHRKTKDKVRELKEDLKNIMIEQG